MTYVDSVERLPGSPLALDPAGLLKPEDYYDSIRNSGPVFLPEINAWLITRSEDILEAASDVVRLSHRYPAGPHFIKMLRESLERVLAQPGAPVNAEAAVTMGRNVLFASDPPDHTRQRRIVGGVFNPKELRLIAVRAREIAHRLIDSFADDGEVELVGQFAWPLPLEVIARRLGVPVRDLVKFRYWAESLAKTLGGGLLSDEDTRDILIALTEFHDYFSNRLDEAAADPQDDVLGLLVKNSETLDRQEMLGILMQFLVAGHETTTALIAGLVLRLAEDPDLAERLRNDRSLIPVFVEECLRLESPSQGTYRRAKVDLEFGDVRIPAGDHIFVPFAAVNRDPSRHANADALDFERTGEPSHIAFGRGAHFCLGAPRARLEANIAIEVILDRLTDIRLVGEQPYAYSPSYMVRGLKHLRLSFTHIPQVPQGAVD